MTEKATSDNKTMDQDQAKGGDVGGMVEEINTVDKRIIKR